MFRSRLTGRLAGTAALAAMLLSGALPAWSAGPDPVPARVQAARAIDDLPNPPELRSRDGVLRATLQIRPAEITVRGRKVRANVVNGSYLAPTLRMWPRWHEQASVL